MSASTPKPSPPVIDEESLEKGDLSTEITRSSEATLTWTNSAPLFRSARRIIIFLLIVWMMFVVVEYVFKINTKSYDWVPPNITPVSRVFFFAIFTKIASISPTDVKITVFVSFTCTSA
jgi:hypothetical protein